MHLVTICGVTASSLPAASSSTVGELLYTLNAPDGGNFGKAVAMSDSYFAVAAPAANSGNGKYYVYNKSDGSLVHTTNGNGGGFGSKPNSIAMTDTRIIFGRPAMNTFKGGYLMHETQTGSYVVGATMPSPASNYDGFGTEIAVDDTAGAFVVGVAYEDTGASNSGSAYYYNMSGVLQATVRNPNAGGTTTEQDNFGYGVAMGPTASAVGAPRDFGRTGVVYHRTTTGTAVRTLSSSMGSNAQMGRDCGITGNLIISWGDANKIQANRIDNGAIVYNVTTQTGSNTMTGSSVGPNVLVQSRFVDDEAATNAGAVDFYDTATGAFVLKILNPNSVSMANGGGQFGFSTATNGTMTIVGAPGNAKSSASGANNGAGQAFVYSTV
jgi:hypothetical protein